MSEESTLKEIFTEEVIQYYKEHQNEITFDLLQKLRSHGNEGKQLALDILETKTDDEEYHLDAFSNRISFNGDRTLKKPLTKMNLSTIHIEEIKRCAQDIEYFKDNYVKIKTRKGVNFPDLREYQNDFLNTVSDDNNESIVAMMPRQCVSAGTIISINGEETSIYDEFIRYPIIKNFKTEKVLEARDASGAKILTPEGYLELERIQKVEPMLLCRVQTINGHTLECAEDHVIMTPDGEVHAKDSLGRNVCTINGISRVVKVDRLGYNVDMYDVVLKNYHLYYSNGILSHNSGKTSTISIFLAHKYNFSFDMNIGILANKGATAREFLSSTKDILLNLPMWMKTGTEIWNMSAIKNENKVRILTDVPSENAFRGFTCAILVVDEYAWIKTTVIQPTLDSLIPSQAALSYKKNIFLSTPHGLNHFSTCVNSAKKRKILKGRDPDEIVVLEDGTKLPLSEVYEKLKSGELTLPNTKDYIDGIRKMEE